MRPRYRKLSKPAPAPAAAGAAGDEEPDDDPEISDGADPLADVARAQEGPGEEAAQAEQHQGDGQARPRGGDEPQQPQAQRFARGGGLLVAVVHPVQAGALALGDLAGQVPGP